MLHTDVTWCLVYQYEKLRASTILEESNNVQLTFRKKLRPLTQTGQSECSICLLFPRVQQLPSCAPLKLIQSFQLFVIFRLVLWISGSLWLNVVSGALLKLMLVIWQGSKEIHVRSGQNCFHVLMPH